MNRLIVCFYPSCQKRTNHFLYNLSRVLESTGRIKCVGYKELRQINPSDVFNADVYHINWFDQSKNIGSFLKRLYFLVVLKLKHKRIVWTVHNAISHEKTPCYNKVLFKMLARFSDVIHVMCKDTVAIAHLENVADKVKLIPHGDYYESYPNSDMDVYAYLGIEKSKKIFLFSGAIRPYKNIEILVRAFRKAFADNVCSPMLLVCGKVESDDYEKKIRAEIGSAANIKFCPGFISDESLAAYLHAASVLVAPYSYRSSLNSGTLPLAFSYGKTLICPDIACVKDVVEKCDCLYAYHYETEVEHVDALAEKLCEVNRYVCDGSIAEKEKLAQKYMQENSWEAHKKEWTELYGVLVC